MEPNETVPEERGKGRTFSYISYGVFTFGIVFAGVTFLLPHDQDDDGVADKNDRCPEAAGYQTTAKNDQGEDVVTNHDCPNPDADGDGILINIPGGLYWNNLDEDQCPDKAGDADHHGCPPPTPEEQAIQAWANCETAGCDDPKATLATLPTAEQTEERMQKAEKLEQTHILDHLTSNYHDVMDIEEVNAEIAKLTDMADLETAKISVTHDLWRSIYLDCDEATQLCYADSEHPLGRSDAFAKAVAFYDFDKVYPKAGDLVEEINHSNSAAALLAAHEQDMSEKDVREALELTGPDDYDFTRDCTNKGGAFYAQAARFGWFAPELSRCLKDYEDAFYYQDGIAFARQAHMEAAAVHLEQVLIRGALEHGTYSVTEDGRRVIVVENHEEWGGS